MKELLGLRANLFTLSIPLISKRFYNKIVSQRVSPINLASYKGMDILEKFKFLIREAGKHKTYLDNKGDIFWPIRIVSKETTSKDRRFKVRDVKGGITNVLM